jgi:hypothetical protein
MIDRRLLESGEAVMFYNGFDMTDRLRRELIEKYRAGGYTVEESAAGLRIL